MRKIFSNFVCFSESPNFTNKYTKLGKTSENLLLSQGLSYVKIPLCKLVKCYLPELYCIYFRKRQKSIKGSTPYNSINSLIATQQWPQIHFDFVKILRNINLDFSWDSYSKSKISKRVGV